MAIGRASVLSLSLSNELLYDTTFVLIFCTYRKMGILSGRKYIYIFTEFSEMKESRAGIFKRSMVARNWVGRGLSYWPARLHMLAELKPWNWFLDSFQSLKIRAPGSVGGKLTWKLNSWTYNYVKVSGQNVERTQTWGFLIHCLGSLCSVYAEQPFNFLQRHKPWYIRFISVQDNRTKRLNISISKQGGKEKI